jgi:signal transduction histidine kinase
MAGVSRPVVTRPRRIAVWTAFVGLAITASVALTPQLRFAYPRPGLHVAIETIAAVISLLTAYLMVGRLQRSGGLDDLLLVLAFALLALDNLFASALPAAVNPGDVDLPLSWTAIAGRLAAGVVIAAAALAPPLRLASRRDRGPLVCSGAALALFTVAALAQALREHLPRLAPTTPPTDSGRLDLSGPVAALAVQGSSTLLFAVAAVGFVRRAERTGDRFFEWIGVACVLQAISRLNYFLYPSIYSRWVYVGDGFRLAFYAVILVGAGWEIQRHWRAAAVAAALQERERIARELHDGVAQELSYIGRQASRLPDDDPNAQRIRDATVRALAESRRAIVTLTAPIEQPFEETFVHAVGDVADRLGVELDLVVNANLPVTTAQADALTRVACEAVANAARHGKADRVRVELLGGQRVRLCVADEGAGFRATPDDTTGFGIKGMQQRMREIGGQLLIHSEPGRGTRVEAVL